jgi:hypothetical protein
VARFFPPLFSLLIGETSLVERYADDEATAQELNNAYEAAFDVGAALAEQKANGNEALRSAAWAASSASHPDELAEGVALEAANASAENNEQAIQCRLIHDIFAKGCRQVAQSLSEMFLQAKLGAG